MDGKLFKALNAKFGEDFVSIVFNTDGAAVFEGRFFSLWPVWVMINNLHPSQRFRSENLILSGLWFGKKIA